MSLRWHLLCFRELAGGERLEVIAKTNEEVYYKYRVINKVFTVRTKVIKLLLEVEKFSIVRLHVLLSLRDTTNGGEGGNRFV